MLRWRALGEVRLAQGAADPHSASLTKCTKGAASVEGMLRTITAWLVTAAVAIGATAFAAMAVGRAGPPVVPGTPAQRGVLREILRGVGIGRAHVLTPGPSLSRIPAFSLIKKK